MAVAAAFCRKQLSFSGTTSGGRAGSRQAWQAAESTCLRTQHRAGGALSEAAPLDAHRRLATSKQVPIRRLLLPHLGDIAHELLKPRAPLAIETAEL